MLALLYPICADINCTSFPSSKQALIAEIFKFTDGCRGCSAVLTLRKPFGFCQGLSRFAIHVYNACFDGYPNRRMTSAIDCVASYIASAFSFCSLVYIIPSFFPVQDYVRRTLSAGPYLSLPIQFDYLSSAIIGCSVRLLTLPPLFHL